MVGASVADIRRLEKLPAGLLFIEYAFRSASSAAGAAAGTVRGISALTAGVEYGTGFTQSTVIESPPVGAVLPEDKVSAHFPGDGGAVLDCLTGDRLK